MLELKGITKDYLAGENTVHALRGIDIKFRRSELVAILGPSGCGKTTMLNIIGGLDHYTEGDLLINGRSTKDFKERDWDAYRNYSVGFVFQSYNLIPHQTVLQNVELALTLSGVSKTERRERAKKALEDVGLGNQLHKRPGEMSGGQMQRVAIARAIVNDPDIILADEPTGALDTQTGVQIMNILREIAKDRLVVMVTHNPELAENYATRTIRMLDGKITDDSGMLNEEEQQAEEQRNREIQEARMSGKKEKKPSMSLFTSFSLSLKNLFTKKGRTMLIAFAGSIGIIGIALIYAISEGFTNYIDTVQEETLSSYPISIQKTETNLGDIMEVFMEAGEGKADHEKDAVYPRSAIYDIINVISKDEQKENDLRTFKKYVEEQRADSESKLKGALNGVKYKYDFDLLVYTKSVDGTIIQSDTQQLMREILADYMHIDMSVMESANSSFAGSSMMMGGMSSGMWTELLTGEDGSLISPLIEKQYDLIYGSWPNDFNEVVLVVDQNNELDDLTLYALGLQSKEEVDKVMNAAMKGEKIKDKKDVSWSYEEICNMEFKAVLNSDCYSLDPATGHYTDIRETDSGKSFLYDSAIPLKVTGIIRPDEDATVAMINGTIGYTKKLTDYVIEHQQSADIIKAQLDNPEIDVITGLPFRPENTAMSAAEKAEAFKAYLAAVSDAEKPALYKKIMSVPPQEMIDKALEEQTKDMKREDIEAQLIQTLTAQMGVDESQIRGYLANMSDEELAETYKKMVVEGIRAQYAQQVEQELAKLTDEQAVTMFNQLVGALTTEQLAAYYDEIMEFSNSTYDLNLRTIGYVDVDEPSSINLYAKSFADKDTIAEVIDEYNEGKEELDQIKYTDYIGIMMSSITTIINAITYVLIAFVSISLIVSSIMIGVITLISVQERTKEIGILRAIGASKRNVSNMFNAETALIGFTSGLLGVVVTYLLCIPINIIIYKLTELGGLKAHLPIVTALILIAISVFLSLISGLIPARSAAKKDPVVALRTE